MTEAEEREVEVLRAEVERLRARRDLWQRVARRGWPNWRMVNMLLAELYGEEAPRPAGWEP